MEIERLQLALPEERDLARSEEWKAAKGKSSLNSRK